MRVPGMNKFGIYLCVSVLFLKRFALTRVPDLKVRFIVQGKKS
jgi:hypothetical protein